MLRTPPSALAALLLRVTALSASSLAGCAIAHDVSEDASMDTRDGGELDAAIDGGGDELHHAPARPSGEDVGGDEERTFALLEFSLDEDTPLETSAIDLDGVNTQDLASASCASAVVVSDGSGGEDNALTRWISLAVGADVNAQVNESLYAGEDITLVHLSGWDGTRSDPRVEVWIAGAASVTGADGGPLTADLSDRAQARSGDFVASLDRPRFVDEDAYVADGVLVAHFDALEWELPVPDTRSLHLQVRDAWLIGSFAGNDLLDVILAARWPGEAIGDELSAQGICEGTSERAAADALLATGFDLLADPEGEASEACDALSTAATFFGAGVTLLPELADDPDDIGPAMCDG